MSSASTARRNYEPVAMGVSGTRGAQGYPEARDLRFPRGPAPMGEPRVYASMAGAPRNEAVKRSKVHTPPTAGPKPIRRPATASGRATAEGLLSLPVFIAAFVAVVLMGGGLLDRWILTAGTEDAVPVTGTPGTPQPSVSVDLASVSGTAAFRPTSRDVPDMVFTRHRVARGETLTRIAYEYGLAPATLISVNGFEKSGDIRPGIALIVPYTDGIRAVPRRGEDAAEVAERFGVEADSLRMLPDGSFFVTGSAAVPDTSAPISDDVFLYPVDGKVLTAFGQGVDGLTGIPYRSEGIDLSADAGTPVLASRSGTVVLTGQHSSYGLYVMMSHPGGWKSFYGHLGRVDVAVGDTLERGDVLGSSGASGNARTPRLNFSLIRNGEPVDPLDYLF